MATVAGMLRKIEAFDLEAEAAEVIGRNTDQLADLNRAQLRKGVGKDGKYLMRYSEDPFFKTPQAAAEYANWKNSLGHTDPEKPFDVPDLFINGYTHSTLTARLQGREVIFGTQVPWSPEISDKYSHAYGLTSDSKQAYRDSTLMPAVRKVFKAKTGTR